MYEDELRALKMFYEKNEALLLLYDERQKLWAHMEQLLKKESDPKRYNNRGGQLLKEEKERKMVDVKLPKVEQRLVEMAEKFETDNNRPFTIFGKRIQEVIDRDYEVKRQEQLTKSGKKLLTPAGSRTPYRANLTGMRTPLTMERTITNHTPLMKAPTTSVRRAKPQLSANSSSTSNTLSTTGKRKLPTTSLMPQAKRKLLGAFTSPSNQSIALKSMNSNAVHQRSAMNKSHLKKPVTLRVYNVGTVVKRRSSKSRRSSGRPKINKRVPDIILPNSSIDSETTSYEGFEHYAVQSVKRSSEIPKPQCLTVNRYYTSPLMRKRTPSRHQVSTPVKDGLLPKDLEFSMII